jgi:Rieske Fe-S protein
MSCEDCLNRRDFLAKSAAAAAAIVVAGGCGDGQIGPPIPKVSGTGDPTTPTEPGVTITISNFPGLANAGTLVDIQHERAVIRTSATTFLAFSKLCTHQQCETNIRNNRFECPCHGSIFANDGSVIRGPDVQNSGIGPLLRLATTFNSANGTLTVA